MQDLAVNGYFPELEECIREEEPWPGYYFLKHAEFKNLMRFANGGPLGHVLDIGCGNAFMACLISSRASRVIGADLFTSDPKVHSAGIDKARGLVAKLKRDNVTIISSSAEQLPFKDESFDTVYSGYMLQYVHDKSSVMRELARVVKKDGIIILVVPNFLERIYSFFQFYLYLMIKGIKFLSDKVFPRSKDIVNDKNKLSERLSKFKNDYIYFPFPGPHGAYRNSAIELVRHMPVSWNKLFRKNGFKIKRSFTTTFISYPLFLTFSVKITVILSKLSNVMVRVYGDKPLIKYLGDNYCALLKK